MKVVHLKKQRVINTEEENQNRTTSYRKVNTGLMAQSSDLKLIYVFMFIIYSLLCQENKNVVKFDSLSALYYPV